MTIAPARHGVLLASVVALASACGGGGGAGQPEGPSSPGSAKLSWMAPTLRTDGSALENLAGYRIYYGTSPSGLRNQISLDNPSAITWTVNNLSAGTWYFAMTAVDRDGLESARTNTVSKTIR